MADSPDDLSDVLLRFLKDDARRYLKLRAADVALLSVLMKYADKLGVSPDQILKEFEEEYRAKHEQLLLEGENLNPGLAAEIDDRPFGPEPDSSRE
jgi:hypothetical protein